MKDSKMGKRIGLFLMVACSLGGFAGCKNNTSGNNNEPAVSDQALAKAIRASRPTVDVEIGEYEHLEASEVKDVDEIMASKGSSSILDMDKDNVINIVYDYTSKSPIQYTPMLFTNIVNANNELHTITVKDRGGNYVERNNKLLSTNGSKITVSKEGGFEYGEVYQIEIHDAPFLCFENKDQSIRTLTIEIEDDPNEEKTYDIKEKKFSITNVDINKVSNKKGNEENHNYSFEYNGEFPYLAKGDIFYVTDENRENNKLDFYGVFESSERVNNKTVVTYTAPNMNDIYNALRLKGEAPINIEDSEVLINDENATREFQQSSLAIAVARATLPLVNNDANKVTNILSNFKIGINVNMYKNRLSMKYSAGIYNYKLADKIYLTIDFGYEKITDYTIDFDVAIRTKWIFPVGVDYKIKCIEDTQEIFYLKSTLTVSVLPEKKPEEKDFLKTITDEIDKVKNDKNGSILSCLGKDPTAKAASSGSKTSWPIILVDLYFLSPISIRFKVDFYIDAGFQAMLMFRQETHSKKIDFCFSNVGGTDTDASNQISKTSNWSISFAGNFHIEVGVRISLSFSILGLHDYLHAEAFAEFFINGQISGLLLADISFTDTSTDFSGYITVDLNVTIGMRVGLDFKLFFVSENVNKTLWFYYLIRVKYENALEHWSELADTEINMNKQSMGIDDTNVLWFNCFNSVTMGFEENKFAGSDTISVFEGILIPKAFIEWTSTNMFQYTVLDHQNYLSIDKNGRLHVSDDAPAQFDAKIRIGVSNWAGTVGDREFTVHFHDAGAHEVYLSYAGDGYKPMVKYLGEYRPNKLITFPEAPERRGMNFIGYNIKLASDSYCAIEEYMPGDTIPMIYEETIELVAWYTMKEQYTVRFYDGKGNLVYEDIVFEGETATAPYAALRDRFMDLTETQFICWNRSLVNITADTEVFGIYIGL